MATKKGGEWRIEIEDPDTADSYDVIGGETSFSWSRTSKEHDMSSKDDGAYQAVEHGSKKVTIRVSGKVKLPDTGLERADTISKLASPKGKVRIVEVATDVVKYEGLMSFGNFSSDWANDEPATWSFDTGSAAAPTVDDLGATAA